MKKRIPMIAALLILGVMIMLNVLVKAPELEPDAVFPLANAKISWEQTYHSGGWYSAGR